MFLVSNKMLQYTGAQTFQKSRSFLKILGTNKVTRSTFDTKDSRTLGDTVHSLVTLATWRSGLLLVILKKIYEVLKSAYFFHHYTDVNGCVTNLV